jgi:Acyl-CoA reductase (LuxC).
MEYLAGNKEIVESMSKLHSREPFTTEIQEFCDDIAKELLRVPDGRNHPDIITLGFWLRKASTEALRKRFTVEDGNIHLGRGVVFHVAPSNVPVNFAYSLFTGLLCGNANIVRVPSGNFPQVQIIISAIHKVLRRHSDMAQYICLVKYGHEQEINDYFSAICDVRIIWGGDATVAEIRKSPLPPRATEVTFPDRFSLAVIDADAYGMMNECEKSEVARRFYNDTYLTDQNACTSPRMVVWLNSIGKEPERKEFWSRLWEIVEKEYIFQDIQGINKLTKKYLLAADQKIIIKEREYIEKKDNRLICVEIDKLTDKLPGYFDNAGYFPEFAAEDISELSVLCNDSRCQTIGYIGKKEMFEPLLRMGVKGIDRIVPIGRTLNFDFIWDGLNLYERLVRTIVIY